MKIKILDSGFADYTGIMGTVNFTNGVSDDISAKEAEHIGNILPVEVVGTGENPSATQKLVDIQNKNAEEAGFVAANLTQGITPFQVDEVKSEAPKTEVVEEKPETPKATELTYDFTEDQLDALVKKGGIAELRAFADPYGVKGRGVAEIVKEMLALKALHTPVAQAPVAEEVVETPEVTEDDDVVTEGQE
jgi:hypothetical protein